MCLKTRIGNNTDFLGESCCLTVPVSLKLSLENSGNGVVMLQSAFDDF